MKVLTVGVYDLMHIGHIKLFEKAKALGEHLTVAVQTDENVVKYKPEAKIFYHQEEREYLVNAIKYVDEVILYDTVDNLVKQIDFDILAVGPDQTNEKFLTAINWCKQNNKAVVVISRTEGISSSLLRGKTL